MHPSGVTKSSTSFGWGKGGNVTSAGWHVTLCDPIWHVISHTGVVISITNCYISVYITLLYYYYYYYYYAGCYYRLRQLRRIRRSLDSDSLVTLVYAAVHSRIDYCNTVLAGAQRTVTDKLQRVLNAAARVITGTRKFDRGLGQILHEELHWLDVSSSWH